jgi:hypothetical protein
MDKNPKKERYWGIKKGKNLENNLLFRQNKNPQNKRNGE